MTPALRQLVAPLLILGVRALPDFGLPLGDLTYLILTAYALIGPRQAIVSLVLLAIVNNFSHAIGSQPAYGVILRHLVVFAAFSSVCFRWLTSGIRPNTHLIAPALAVCGLITVHSVLISRDPLVSVLKCLSFSQAAFSVVAGAALLNTSQRRIAWFQVFGVASVVLVLGLPLLFLPQGYRARSFSDGYQSLMSHPQAFGVFAAVTSAALLTTAVASRNPRSILWLLAASAAIATVASRARSGAIALVAGLVLAWCGMLALNKVYSDRRSESPKASRILFLALLLLIVALPSGNILQSTRRFIVKYVDPNSRTSVFDALVSSRSRMATLMINDIKDYPVTGIGFGIPSVGSGVGVAATDPITGLPIMASTEKGIAPLMLLEELGLPLGLLSVGWWLYLVWQAFRRGVVPFAVSSTAFITNFGEANFFAPGGIGLFLLVCTVLSCYYEPPQRNVPQPALRPYIPRASLGAASTAFAMSRHQQSRLRNLKY